MEPENYFNIPNTVAQKQYEALRAFFVEKYSAQKTAEKFGYTTRAFNSIVSDFRKKLKDDIKRNDPYFVVKKKGPKRKTNTSEITDLILKMRKKYYSIGDIKVILDSMSLIVSEKYIHLVLLQNGFARLPRRSNVEKERLEKPGIEADKSVPIDFSVERFHTKSAGILLFLPYLEYYGVGQAVNGHFKIHRLWALQNAPPDSCLN